MRKKLTLMFVALLSIATYAATVTWKVTSGTPVAANSTLTDDDAVTVKTVYATTKSENGITFGGQTFESYIQCRVDAFPSAENVTGTEKSGSTPLVVTPKKDLSMVVYYRRQPVDGAFNNPGDSKDLRFYDQATPTAAINGTKVDVDQVTDDKKYAYVHQSFALKAGKTYTLCAKGTTIQLYGWECVSSESESFSAKVVAALAAPVEGVATLTLDADCEADAAVNVPLGTQLIIDGAGHVLTLGESTNFILNDNITLKNVKIDASELTVPLIALTPTPADGTKKNQDVYTDAAATDINLLNAVTVENVMVKNLKAQFISNGGAAWALENFSLTKSIIQLDATGKNFIAFDAGGTTSIKNITISENTIYNINETSDAYFIRFNNASNAAKAFGTNNGTSTFDYKLTKNTIINTFKAKNFGNNTPNNSKVTMEVTQNIFADVKNISKFVQGNCTKTIEKNVGWGATSEASMADIVNEPAFAAPTVALDLTADNGGIDLTIDEASKAAEYQAGDPRWVVKFVKKYAITTSAENGTVTTKPEGKAAPGTTVMIKTSPNKGYKLEYIEISWLDDDLTTHKMTETDDSPTFTMPESDVTINAIFKEDVAAMGAPTDPIDVVVPATEGEDGTATDLATFLDGCLENSENPAYIKLTLQGGAKYTISKPIETISSISIIANEGNPAIIDASALKGALIQVNSNKVSGNPNEKGYYTNIEAVNIKNINVTALNGELFNAAGAKYLIPTLNIENVYVEENGRTIIDMNGSALDEFNVSKSTFFAPAGATFYKAGAALETAGVGTQVVNISYNTLYKVGGFNGVTNDDKAKTNIDFNHNIVVEYPNFIAAMNADLVTLLAQNNSFQQLVDDTYEDISNAEEGATNSIVGPIAFANDPTTGDFALAACDQKTEKIGDPRWLVAVKYITNDDLDAAGDDIAVAINNGIQEGFTKFQLQDNTRYEARQSIVADKGLILAGKNVKIEVLHNDPFILLSKTPTGGFMPKASTEAAAPALNRAAGVEYTDYYKFDELTLSGLKVNGLKNSIIYDNNVKYCVTDLTIDDCVMQLETEAVKYEALIAFQAGGVNNLTIKNSTFYGNNEVAKYFVRYNNSARIDRFGFDKADDTWSFTYENNTFYGLLKSDGQWGNYSGIVGKNAQGIVTVKNNIWYNCDAQTMRRMLGSKNFSQFSKASQMENNTFIVGGEAVDQGNYGNGSDLTSDPGFERPAVGNFTLSAYSQQFEKKTGDPRWYADGGHYNATGIEGVEAEKANDGAWYTIQGVRVDKPAKGLYIHNGKKIVVK